MSMIAICREVFQEVLNFENCLEQFRRDASFRPDYTLGAVFNIFASNPQYKITIDEFLFGLDRLDLRISTDEARLMFARYDSDEDGRLGFWEISNMFPAFGREAKG